MSDSWKKARELLPLESFYRPIRRAHWRAVGAIVLLGFVAFVVAAAFALAEPQPSLAYLLTLLGIGVPLLLVGLAAIIVLGMGVWRSLKLTGPSEEARRLLGDGQAAEAGRLLDDLCRRARLSPLLHTVLVYNRGLAYLKTGDPERAISLLTAALWSGWPRSRLLPAVYGAMLCGLAAANAVAGALEAAELIQEEARRLLPEKRRGMLVLGDAFLDVRRGRHADLVARFQDEGSLAEVALSGTDQRSFCALQAFAHARLGGASSALVRPFTEAARPAHPGELDYLAGRWPELAQFLREQGLSSSGTG